MTYEVSEAGRVTLAMERAEYDVLMAILVYGIEYLNEHGESGEDQEKATYWRAKWFANELNHANPAWEPYEIPEEFRPRVNKFKSSGRT